MSYYLFHVYYINIVTKIMAVVHVSIIILSLSVHVKRKHTSIVVKCGPRRCIIGRPLKYVTVTLTYQNQEY